MIHITEDEAGSRLDRVLKKKLPSITQGFIEKALRKGEIKVSGKKSTSNYRVQIGDIIEVGKFDIREVKKTGKKTDVNSEIYKKYGQILLDSVIYKDKNIIAINKPQGLPAQGGSKVKISVDQLLDVLQFEAEERPKIVHRIDKDTSGVMLLARNSKSAQNLTKMFKEKTIEKTYLAVCIGTPEPHEGKIAFNIIAKKSDGKIEKAVIDESGKDPDSKRSATLYKVLDKAADKVSLVELTPITGRMHQLRVHMNHIGHPIMGDGKYGGSNAFIRGFSEVMHLHALKVRIPAGNKIIEVKAEIPKHMKETMKELGLQA